MHRSGCASVLRCVGLWLVLSISSPADDWPQWLGPQRDSTWREQGILDKFPTDGLKILWRRALAAGYSGPAVSGNRVFVMDYVRTAGKSALDFNNRDRVQGKERVVCLDATTGKIVWTHEYACNYNISYATGPRCTPTVGAGRVYTLGAEGHLHCLNAKTGRVEWAKDLKREYKVETPLWGFCGHPLLDGNQLICLVGGEGSVVVAFDKTSGKERWRSLTAREPGYCPPTIVIAGGKRQLLVWHVESINSLDPQSGRRYWSVPLEPSFGMAIAAPRVANNLLFASGIRNECVVLRLAADRPAADEAWRGKSNNSVYCANSTPYLKDGMIYGCDCNSGHLRGVSLENGERRWETLQPTAGGDRRAPHGTAFIVAHEDRFFLTSETGNLIICRLTPEGYEELDRTHLLEPTSSAFGRNVLWSHPAFASQCVFARNDKEIICASLAEPTLPAASPPQAVFENE